MEYTTGNWKVNDLIDHANDTEATMNVARMTFNKDYARTSQTSTETDVVNTTSNLVGDVENVRFAYSKVNDIYDQSSVDPGNQLDNHRGVQIMVEAKTQLMATNSVSGKECILPMKSRIVVRVPAASLITQEAVAYAVNRAIAAAYGSEDSIAKNLMSMARGALDPTE